eukprot:5089391-Pyramimonas_sp.AAC.1
MTLLGGAQDCRNRPDGSAIEDACPRAAGLVHTEAAARRGRRLATAPGTGVTGGGRCVVVQLFVRRGSSDWSAHAPTGQLPQRGRPLEAPSGVLQTSV